jgi:hypothetical protein
MVEQYFLFWCFMVSIGGGVDRVVPVVMMVGRGDATSMFGFFPQSILLCCTVCQFAETLADPQ